jgi:hypothetical protein
MDLLENLKNNISNEIDSKLEKFLKRLEKSNFIKLYEAVFPDKKIEFLNNDITENMRKEVNERLRNIGFQLSDILETKKKSRESPFESLKVESLTTRDQKTNKPIKFEIRKSTSLPKSSQLLLENKPKESPTKKQLSLELPKTDIDLQKTQEGKNVSNEYAYYF